ncbi:hypothetical protein Tco_0708922 [Tanacetum coccineum]
MQEDSGPGKEHVLLPGPNQSTCTTSTLTAYPRSTLKTEIQNWRTCHLGNPASIIVHLSSMKNLDETDNFGDQFLNDKPTEDDQEKTNVVDETNSIRPDPSHQTNTSSSSVTYYQNHSIHRPSAKIPTVVEKYVGTKIDDALLKALERHTADLVEKYSVLPAPESSKKQESEKSLKEIIRIKREQGEKKPEPMYTIKSTDKAALEEFDLKGALFNIMHKNKSANRNPANYRLYHALMEALIEDENAMDKEVADKVKDHKRKRDSDDDEDDDDEGPSARSNQGESTKRRRHDSSAHWAAQPPC